MFQPLLCSLLELHFENSFENVLILFLYSEFLSIFWVPLNILCQFQFSCLAPPACRNVMHTALSPIILSPLGHCCPIVNIRGHPLPPDFRNKYFNYCSKAGTGTDTEAVTAFYYQEKLFVAILVKTERKISLCFPNIYSQLKKNAQNKCLKSFQQPPALWAKTWSAPR